MSANNIVALILGIGGTISFQLTAIMYLLLGERKTARLISLLGVISLVVAEAVVR